MDAKFGTLMHIGNIPKIDKEKLRKGAWTRSRNRIKFDCRPTGIKRILYNKKYVNELQRRSL